MTDGIKKCPFWKKNCDAVCPTCPLYIKVVGTDNNKDEQIDNFGCALSWMPVLEINTANQMREAGAATESYRNESVRGNQELVLMMAGLVDTVSKNIAGTNKVFEKLTDQVDRAYYTTLAAGTKEKVLGHE